MKSTKRRAGWVFTVIAGAFALASGAAVAAEQGWVPPMIQQNALLNTIYKQDPQQAVRLAIEAERTLALATPDGPGAGKPEPRTRGGLDGPDPGSTRDGGITEGNRKAFDENPVLREIYSRSPLAALRMLKRLREAAGKN